MVLLILSANTGIIIFLNIVPLNYACIGPYMLNTPDNSEISRLELYATSIRSRRTINFFKNNPVETSVILEAIELARWAPNHKKTEPWHFHLLGPRICVQVKDLITDIKAVGRSDTARIAIRERLDAIPGWLVMTCNVSTDPIQQSEDYAACACAAQNMMLYLWQAGVGMKWTTGNVIRDERFLQLMRVDKTRKFVTGLFWYGYPQHVPEQTRKSLEEIVEITD